MAPAPMNTAMKAFVCISTKMQITMIASQNNTAIVRSISAREVPGGVQLARTGRGFTITFGYERRRGGRGE